MADLSKKKSRKFIGKQDNKEVEVYSSLTAKMSVVLTLIFVLVFMLVAYIVFENFNIYFKENSVKPWLLSIANASTTIFQEKIENLENEVQKDIKYIVDKNFEYPLNFANRTEIMEFLKNTENNSDNQQSIRSYQKYLDDSEDINTYFQNALLETEYLNNIFVVDKSGIIVFSSNSVYIGETIPEKKLYTDFKENELKIINTEKDQRNNVTSYIAKDFGYNPLLNSNLIIVYEFNMTKLVTNILKYIDDSSLNAENKLSNIKIFVQDIAQRRFLYYQDYDEYVFSNDAAVNRLNSEISMEHQNHGEEKVFLDSVSNSFIAFVNSSQTNYIVGASYSKDIFKFTINKILLNLTILGVVSLIVSLIIIFFAIHSLILNKINSFLYIMNKISSGDLTQSILSIGNDEISHMGKMLNIFLASLRTSWKDVLNRVEELENSEEILDEDILSSLKRIEKISGSVKESNEYVEKQTEYVSETSAAVEEISRNLDSLNNLIEEQSENVNKSSSSMEELIANIKSITELTEDANKQVLSLSKISNEGQLHQDELIAQIKVIAQTSEQLHEANSLIASMADQTNLLSMNAAIEAAHAGETGKGFAVVAEEIRSLAEQVAEQSDSVSQTIYQIQDLIDQVVQSTEISSDSFNSLINQMSKVTNYIMQIQEAMREQSQGTKEILQAITSLKNISQNVRIGSKEISDGNKQILEAVLALSDVNAKVRNSSDEIFEDMKEVLQKVQEMKQASINNKKSLKDIKMLKNKFQIGIDKEIVLN